MRQFTNADARTPASDGVAETRNNDRTRLSVLVILAALVGVPGGLSQAAQTIEFPEEELASESVLPVFDQPVSVKNRNVSISRRFEIGGLGAYSLTEPFFNNLSLGGTLSYHFNEEQGINIFGLYFLPGESDYSRQLNPIPGTTNVYANLQYAPAPKYLVTANYQYTAFYGKLSLTKDYVMNLSLYGLVGAGLIGIGDVNKPAFNFGLGQKFYFTPSFALRFDLRFLLYQGPDPLSKRLDNQTGVQPASYFDEKLNFSTLLTFGAIYMFPKL